MTEQGRRMSHALDPGGLAALEENKQNSEFSLRRGMKSEEFYDEFYDSASSIASNENRMPQSPIEPEIAARENRQVFFSRLLVMGVLFCSAVTVGCLAYRFVLGEEEKDYKAQVSERKTGISIILF
jgi:hypothetical protein